MSNGSRAALAAIVLTLLPAAAHAACTELVYSDPVLDCQNLGKSGSADFAASCAYVQAPPVEVEVECPGMWVNVISIMEKHAAACKRVGLVPSSINGAVCASGRRQPTSGTGYDSINYRYGKAATSLSPGGKSTNMGMSFVQVIQGTNMRTSSCGSNNHACEQKMFIYNVCYNDAADFSRRPSYLDSGAGPVIMDLDTTVAVYCKAK